MSLWYVKSFCPVRTEYAYSVPGMFRFVVRQPGCNQSAPRPAFRLQVFVLASMWVMFRIKPIRYFSCFPFSACPASLIFLIAARILKAGKRSQKSIKFSKTDSATFPPFRVPSISSRISKCRLASLKWFVSFGKDPFGLFISPFPIVLKCCFSSGFRTILRRRRSIIRGRTLLGG